MADNKMLINAINEEQIRIAITSDGELSELEIESTDNDELRGNIYKATILRVEPSLQAAFLDIGQEKNGFLQINDIHPKYFKKKLKSRSEINKTPISQLLEAGQEMIVQVLKEERGLKGATLTNYVSLPGRYVVLMPGSNTGGISRKIKNASQRERLKSVIKELKIPKGIEILIRTAGLDRALNDLSRDTASLLKLWEKIQKNSEKATEKTTLLYKEGNVANRVIRDYFSPDIKEILVDDQKTFQEVKDFITSSMPRYRSRIKLYEDKEPIFTKFHIDKQVNNAFTNEVILESGGSIVIDTLEALVAVDVNSGKATKGERIEETALRVNSEAAIEIARQLRLRDLGGLVVIDFIDMQKKDHKITVEKIMANAIKNDKAKIEMCPLSKFGLMEISRQRLKRSLINKSSVLCPVCSGRGRFKSPEMVALEALRKIQGAVIMGGVNTVKVSLSHHPAIFLLNHKKNELISLEKNYNVCITIVSDTTLVPDDIKFEMSRQNLESSENE